MGDGNWTDDYLNDAHINFKTDEAIGKLIETFQKGVIYLVNSRDGRRLMGLQACTQEVYRRAEQALSLGKKMDIDTTNTRQPDDN